VIKKDVCIIDKKQLILSDVTTVKHEKTLAEKAFGYSFNLPTTADVLKMMYILNYFTRYGISLQIIVSLSANLE